MGKGGGGEDMTHKHTYSIPSADDQNDARCIECGRLQPTTQLAKHTPGPWNVRHYRVAPTNCQWADVTDSTGGLITHVPSSKGNAALIAAAPAMYEALQALLALIGDEDLPDNGELSGASICDFARSALAQAEGREG